MPKRVEFGFNDPYHSPGFLLWRVSGAWQRAIRDALTDLDLTHAQFVFMANVAWQAARGEVTQVQVAQAIGMDAMTASSLARGLEARGLLRRSEKTGDARAKRIALSESGLELVRRAVPKVEAADIEFFAALSGSAAFTAELRRLLGVT
jgi:DNA-binding MarR family transcriptional regulator